jgi:hypothetical protein
METVLASRSISPFCKRPSEVVGPIWQCRRADPLVQAVPSAELGR